ncbi:MAG: archaeosortase/exosortase family protein [Limnothrix sp. RL_2_0]|nr:archaeosortase/exosortase family protein [Limnothrix sp. RL_2_0]
MAASLLRHSSRVEVWGLGALFLLVVCYCQWDESRVLRSGPPAWSAIAVGIVVGLWVLFKAWNFVEDEAFLRCLPVASLLSWGLVSFGWDSFERYWSGFVLFGFLALPWDAIYGFVDLSLWTAQFSHLLLLLMGLEGERLGTLIRLGSGSIEVYHGCSGLKLILQLVGFSLMYLVLNPQKWWGYGGVILGAIAIGFGLNGVRVAIMAILISLGDELAFEYWHLGDGSLIFSAIAVGCLGIWGWGLQRWLKNVNDGIVL